MEVKLDEPRAKHVVGAGSATSPSATATEKRSLHVNTVIHVAKQPKMMTQRRDISQDFPAFSLGRA